MRQLPLTLSPELCAEVDRLGLEFLAEILETETSRHPGNVDALAELGHVYTRQGRIERGLEIDRELVRVVPDNPTVHYNLACSLALLAVKDEAFVALERAVALGYCDAQFLLEDDDLASLRADPRFQALVRRLETARPKRPRKA